MQPTSFQTTISFDELDVSFPEDDGNELHLINTDSNAKSPFLWTSNCIIGTAGDLNIPLNFPFVKGDKRPVPDVSKAMDTTIETTNAAISTTVLNASNASMSSMTTTSDGEINQQLTTTAIITSSQTTTDDASALPLIIGLTVGGVCIILLSILLAISM